MIDGYTREAGVRKLEREIGAICRKVARAIAEGDAPREADVVPTPQVRELLGRRALLRARSRAAPASRAWRPGLAWTPVGGDVLFVEATAYAGRRAGCMITGQLGDVMRESAQAALSYVRGHAERARPELDATGSPSTTSTSTCPPGAIPKDGPSAGRHDGDGARLADHAAARCAPTWR